MEDSRRTCLPSPARRILANTTGAIVRAAGREALPSTGRRQIRRARSGRLRGVGDFRGVELADLVLTSERLTLRPWRAADVPRLVEIMADPTMHEFLALPQPYTVAAAAQFVGEVAAQSRTAGTGLSCALV